MHPPFAKRLLFAGGFALLMSAASECSDSAHSSQTTFLLIVTLPLQLLAEPAPAQDDTSSFVPAIALLLMAGVAGVGLLSAFRLLKKREARALLSKHADESGGADGRGIAITDLNGRIISYNSSFEKIFQTGDADLMGTNLLRMLTTSATQGRYYLLRADAAESSVANSVMFDRSDSPTLLGVRSEDIHGSFGRYRIFFFNTFVESKPTDDWTRGMELVKCGFYNFAPVIFVTLSAEGDVLMVNEYFEGILQMTQRQIVGKKWFENFVPDDRREYCRAIFQQCLSSGEEQYFESVIADSLGRKRVIYWKCGVIILGTRKLVLYFGQDITEQEAEHIQLASSIDSLNKLTEELENRVRQRTSDLEIINMNLEMQIEERKEIEKQLVTSERLHMAMAHNFPNGIIAVLDQNLRFVLVDGKELASLGYSSVHLIGKSIFSQEFGLDEGAMDSLMRAFKGETTLYEVRFKEMYYNLTAVPLADSDDLVEKILVVFQNISQHKKLEESLYSSIDQERKLNELKSRFVTMASHEFRTPLSTILSSVFLMESYSGEMYEQKKQSHINRIKRTVNALAESLNDFLRLGKLEEGRVELILTETAVDDYMNEIVKEIQTIMRPGQRIRYQHDGINVNVLLDRNLTRGILLNLLSNAGKYSPENAEVYLSTSLSPSELVIQVADQGLGIPKEEREHIFDRFFRAVNALHIEGTGLGLHIVKKYVELMNGTIDFTSGDVGTTFTVRIPLQYTQDNVRLILR